MIKEHLGAFCQFAKGMRRFFALELKDQDIFVRVWMDNKEIFPFSHVEWLGVKG